MLMKSIIKEYTEKVVMIDQINNLAKKLVSQRHLPVLFADTISSNFSNNNKEI